MFRLIGRFIKHILPYNTYCKLKDWFLNFRKNYTFKKIKSRIQRYYQLAIKYPRIYRKYSSDPIDENKVLFIEPTKTASNNYRLIYHILEENYSFDIHFHSLQHFSASKDEYDNRCVEMLKDLATAKYVFIDEACNAIGRVSIRKETIIAQLWHACGAFKKFGFSTAEKIFGTDRKTMEKYPYYKNDTFVTVSSPEVVWAYSEAMGLPEEKILPIGVSRTDVFFDEDFKKAARNKLNFYFPSSMGKKIILFAPTFRGRIAKGTTATAFSIQRFYEELSKDYVLIMKHHPHAKNIPDIPEKYRNFAVDFTRTMTIEELLCVADICISDYSSLIFEFSLFEKPMIFFDYDIDEYFDWRGFYYNYDELTPGPAFKTNREMIDYIKQIDTAFDKQKVVDFKNKFMSSCDGHSTERIMNKVFGNDLDKHIKEQNSGRKDSVQLFGGSLTPQSFEIWNDIDELSAKEIKNKLLDEYPYLKDKTIIAYICTKQDIKIPEICPYLGWQDLWEDLDEKYSILYMNVPKGFLPKKFQQKRFINAGKILTEKELSSIADIILTDWNFAAGVYGFRTKRTYLYLPDYKWYCADEEDYINSSEMLRDKGFLFENTEDLISAIQRQGTETQTYESLIQSYRKVCEHFDWESVDA